MKKYILLLILMLVPGILVPVYGQQHAPVSDLKPSLLSLAAQASTLPALKLDPAGPRLKDKLSNPVSLSGKKGKKKKMSRTRFWTFWTVTGLGVTYGTFGLLTSMGAAAKHAEYMETRISYDAQRLGDEMQDIQEKAYSQLTLSAFFIIISVMMTMDLQYGG